MRRCRNQLDGSSNAGCRQPRDRQAKSHPRQGLDLHSTDEWLEDRFPLLDRNSRASIADVDHHHLTHLRATEANRARAILQRIPDEGQQGRHPEESGQLHPTAKGGRRREPASLAFGNFLHHQAQHPIKRCICGILRIGRGKERQAQEQEELIDVPFQDTGATPQDLEHLALWDATALRAETFQTLQGKLDRRHIAPKIMGPAAQPMLQRLGIRDRRFSCAHERFLAPAGILSADAVGMLAYFPSRASHVSAFGRFTQ